MLDFQKLILQIEQVGKDTVINRFPQEQICQVAQETFDDACKNPQQMAESLTKNQPWVLWPVALPIEPFGSSYAYRPRTEPVTVVATDGSQIMPSHHEIHSCYVLNIGKVAISYGANSAAMLASEPRLFHRPEDLYPLVDRRRFHIDELYVSLERNLLELDELYNLAEKAKQRELPVVALLDGTLIPWSVEKMSDEYQRSYLRRMLASMERFKTQGIPLVGYLSHSRAADLVNDLRIWKCPYDLSNCRQMCGHLNEEDFPCSKLWPLSDRHLLSGRLVHCHRTGAFLSGASVSKLLPEHEQICFTYLNVGLEIARLEIPRWVFANHELVKLTMETILSQVNKGQGYPVALAEAHNQAVIRAQDRKSFFELLSRHLSTLGVKRISVSPKESSKRQGIV